MTVKECDVAQVDISEDNCQMILEESLMSHSALMHETRANAQSAHSIVRHAGARKYNMEDPLEAAATEKILQ